MTAPRVLIVGYYGYGNYGDELLLQNTIRMIRTCWPDAHLCALYNVTTIPKKHYDPFGESRLFQELTYCPRGVTSLFKSLFKATHVVIGGGGVFQNKSSTLSLLFYTGIVIVAKLFKKPVLALGQGLGPIRGKIGRGFLKLALKSITTLSVRDPESQDIVTQLSPTKPVQLGADMAYYRAVTICDPAPQKKAPLIGLSLSGKLPQRVFSVLEKALIEVPQDYLFLCGDYYQDPPAMSRSDSLKAKFVDRLDIFSTSTKDFGKKGVLERYTLPIILSTRYHTLVWASLRGIPFLALAEDPKLIALAKQLGQPYVDLTGPLPEPETLTAMIISLWKNRVDLKAVLLPRVSTLIAQSATLESVFFNLEN